MFSYPGRFTPETGGFVVTFVDVPEAITEGDSPEEAMEYAVDALATALSVYIRRRLPLPAPSKLRGRNIRAVRLPALVESKLGLYSAMEKAGVRKAELARRLGCRKSQVDRLLGRMPRSRPRSPLLHAPSMSENRSETNPEPFP